MFSLKSKPAKESLPVTHVEIDGTWYACSAAICDLCGNRIQGTRSLHGNCEFQSFQGPGKPAKPVKIQTIIGMKFVNETVGGGACPNLCDRCFIESFDAIWSAIKARELEKIPAGER